MASGSAGEGAGSNTDKKTSKVVISPHRNKTTPGPTLFGFVAKSVLLGPEPE